MVKTIGSFFRNRVVGVFFLATLAIASVLVCVPWEDGPLQVSGILLGEQRYPVHCVAFAPDGKTLAAGGGLHELEGEIRLWDVATSTTRAILRGHGNRVYAVTFAADGQTLATASTDGVVKLWDVAAGQERVSVPLFPDPESLRGAFSPTGQALALTGWELGVVRLWRRAADRGGALTTTAGPIAFAGEAPHLVLWRVDPGAKRAGHRANGQRLIPEGKLGNWSAVESWDVTIGQHAFTLKGHTDHVWSLAFSPDGRTLASASSDATVRLWDVATGRERLTLREHTDQVNAVAFAPDGKRLASASHDRTVRVWDAVTGCQQVACRGHAGAVTCVAFAPGGEWVASGSYDKTVRLWALVKVR